MKTTGLKDVNRVEILEGANVMLEGLQFEVCINQFNNEYVIDGDTGQELLVNVHDKCIVIQ